ncbi:hypothetical protein [Terrimonas alba]|uniref:hypothetical protein n=1 Tax=Terrimonas alba TaxID=3349636 RepID=UPI0035F29B6E
MKIAKVLFHPFLLLLSFCLIVISGQHLGGFYVTYIFMTLPYGALHSIAAIVGFSLIALSYLLSYRQVLPHMLSLLNLVGVGCLIFSFVWFFYQDPTGYNLGTFEQPLPLITVCLFALLAAGFIANSILLASSRT